MLTLRQLQYFVALAELRHFGKAAERCCVTQPALSMQIKELEDTLGVQLVRRQRGHMSLTVHGKEVAARAQVLLNTARDLQDYAHHCSRTLVGELRLGVIPSVAPYLLPKVLPKLEARYPELRLKLQETLTQALVSDVLEGGLDAVVVALPLNDARIESTHMFDDAFLLARSRNAGRRKARNVSVASLTSERMLLLNDGHCLRDQALEYCQTIDPDSLSEFGASSLSTIMKMVASGYGVTLLPEIAAETELADPRIELLRFEDPEPKRTIGLAWLKSSMRSRDFIALARLIVEAHGTTPTGTDDNNDALDRLAS
jgi:LysR family transcriptional regulator, hydrogen peroxide-inducible genes activator